jgi:hypothetical protein
MNESRPAEAPRAGDEHALDSWVFRDRESMEKRFGMEMERILELYNTDAGKKALLEQMKQSDPTLNGNVEGALNQVNRNIEQLQKKETFLGKMMKFPGNAVKAVGNTMKRHPVLTTAAGIAAIIALLYFTGTLAPTAGQYGSKLVQAFKSVLGKLSIGTPEVAMDATAAVPVTGGTATAEMAEVATEALQSPGMMEEVLQQATEARAAGAAGESLSPLSAGAESILQSQTGASSVLPEIADPLQRALQGLPPLE